MAAQARRQGKDISSSPTAQRILTAAKRILSDEGYARLTLQAVEKESGEYRALVAYYFGNKQGLIDAIVEDLMQSEDAALRERLAAIESPDERVRALIDEQRQISADWRGFRAFYELLPHIMRDERLRTDLAVDYAESRELDRRTLAAGQTGRGDADLDKLAALSVAIVEGLAVQYAADQEHFDHEGTYRLWEDMVLAYLRTTSRP
jgi:TetR/AcrR family transcriptional regulator, transcriptional repressor of bet genes